MRKHIFYAQSGGATAVINATACGLIQSAAHYPNQLGAVLAGRYGILGALQEELIDTSLEDPKSIAKLFHTPGCAFGSCRYQLKSYQENPAEYERLFAVFDAHDIGYFVYNGGGDSQDTTHKIALASRALSYPLQCIGLPKTIDNDLAMTDNSPGFGSVAKYIATSVQETALDVQSMCMSSTKVFILEVMGRHAGWITAAADLGAHGPNDAPHILLFPEIAFDAEKFLAKVDECVCRVGYCVVVASEGIRDQQGKLLGEHGGLDAFGHPQLGGVAPSLAEYIKNHLGYKTHWAVADYLQRAARHLASQTDLDQAYALGRSAIDALLAGTTDIMLSIKREKNHPYPSYSWSIEQAALDQVAKIERCLPRDYIDASGFKISSACRDYLFPLIQGEAYPPFKNGLPDYVQLKNQLVPKRLAPRQPQQPQTKKTLDHPPHIFPPEH
jgi:6-phosphofructokinase 1